MKFHDRPFQTTAVEHAYNVLVNGTVGTKQLYAAPTGVGKSVVELRLQERLGEGAWIVSPREEIIAGLLDKLGDPSGDMLSHSVCTPIRLRNMLLKGSIPHPKYLIWDESHHQEAESYQQLELLSGICPAVGYTATPYRGSPKSTKDFLDRWGQPLWLISYSEAVEEGYIKMPTFETLPLIDDDIVTVRGGEFDVTSLEGVTMDRMSDLADHSRRWYSEGRWTKPTVYALPSTACCVRFQGELNRRGLPAFVVNAETPRADRYTAFRAAEEGILAILHINVVSEGVDLKLRRYIDAAATMSPVSWVQRLGRVTRPTDEIPEYVCTNRNLMRHAYILEGVVPLEAVAKSVEAFPRSERSNARVVGMEAIGRFKPTTTKLLSGINIDVYSLSAQVGLTTIEYACIVHPAMEAVWASKVNQVVDGAKQWGKWTACEAPEGLQGFSSQSTRAPSDKQKAWWDRSASCFGLDPSQEVNRKSFQALPVLADLGMVLR